MALVAIVLVATLGLSPASASAGAFCEKEIVHDYLKPLKGLPPLRRVPVTEELPFGPAQLRLNQRGLGSVVPWSEDLDFRLLAARSGTTANLRLDWTVTASLVRVDRHGQVQDVLRTVARRLAKLANNRDAVFRLPFQFKPGLYRVEIVFQNRAGKRLGRFGNYFRALRLNPNHRLTLNGTSFAPGQTVFAQAGEFGVGWISLNDVYSIESYDGSIWSKAAISPKQASLLIGPLLGPGEATACWDFPIPANAPPGLYRFVVEGATFENYHGNFGGRGSTLALTSEFSIMPD